VIAFGLKMDFKTWCREKWYEHIDELDAYKQPLKYGPKEYFAMYKWWLKREFQHQKNKDSK